MDDCAVTCGDVEDAVGCCIAAHGRGADAVLIPASCSGGACDPNRYLSEAAAICAAQAQGLVPGVSGCTATFEWSAVGANWEVVGWLDACDDSFPHGRKLSMARLDATTGVAEYVTAEMYVSDLPCEAPY